MTPNFRTIGFPERLFRPRGGTFRLEKVQTGSDAIVSGYVSVGGLVVPCNVGPASSIWRT